MMTMTVIAIALIMLYSLWLTKRLFQVERQLIEYSKRITILSKDVSQNKDKIMLKDVEREQEVVTEELIREYKYYSWGNEQW